MPTDLHDTLPPREANFVPLSPLDFLERAAEVYRSKVAIVNGAEEITYAEFFERARSLASALRALGVRRGDVVSWLAPNVPSLLEAHFGVPMAGAVLNAINTRLDAQTIAFILQHAESRVFVVDARLQDVAEKALALLTSRRPIVLLSNGTEADAVRIGARLYEAVRDGTEGSGWLRPVDEWESISLNYTSGTTGNPKGALYHHRGAYLNALGNVITFGLSPESVYLWTLPMFHCNGWTYPWAVTAVGARHICLPVVDPAEIFRLIDEHKVTHLCAAPVVLTMLIHAPAEAKRRFSHGPVRIATGGAAPPSSVIAQIEELGFNLTHLYGMTECYGPSTGCAPQPEWEGLPLEERARLMARQGVRNLTVSAQSVIDQETGIEVPADGKTLGELVIRGNSVMKGYLKNTEATDETLRDGWLHTGDLAVLHPDRYVEIKDRAKDIIISGGENISSLEVEEVLYRHPDVMEAAVVALPDEKWGETPCAFVTLKPASAGVTETDIIAYCRQNLAHFKAPTRVVFGLLPKTSTGKIQKFDLRVRAAAGLGS